MLGHCPTCAYWVDDLCQVVISDAREDNPDVVEVLTRAGLVNLEVVEVAYETWKRAAQAVTTWEAANDFDPLTTLPRPSAKPCRVWTSIYANLGDT